MKDECDSSSGQRGAVDPHPENECHTAVIQREGEHWIGWIEEVPGVNSQGVMRDELMENLRSAVREALEIEREPDLACGATDHEHERRE